jgi:hypothetical protein
MTEKASNLKGCTKYNERFVKEIHRLPKRLLRNKILFRYHEAAQMVQPKKLKHKLKIHSLRLYKCNCVTGWLAD